MAISKDDAAKKALVLQSVLKEALKTKRALENAFTTKIVNDFNISLIRSTTTVDTRDGLTLIIEQEQIHGFITVNVKANFEGRNVGSWTFNDNR